MQVTFEKPIDKKSYPLHHAVAFSSSSLLVSDIEESLPVKIDCRDDNGNTMLHLAVKRALQNKPRLQCSIDRHDEKLITFLLKRGASKNAENNFGQTPLEYGRQVAIGLNEEGGWDIIRTMFSSNAPRLDADPANKIVGRHTKSVVQSDKPLEIS